MTNVRFEDLNLERVLFVDVRAPLEFKKGHIDGAINIPLLDDEQRALVGTTYKQEGQKAAIKLGLQLAGPEFLRIYESLLGVKKADASREIIIYCARGGMRSGIVHHFMKSLKIHSRRLTGGYKAYRKVVLDTIRNTSTSFIILNGYTGSGKTTLLKQLEAQNMPVIDLEYMAKHMGSAFGAIPYAGQRATQQQFENQLATKLLYYKKEKNIFLEGESKRIGHVQLDSLFFDKMKRSKMILIERTEAYRIEKILEDYDLESPAFIEALERIKKKLGGEKHQEVLKLLKEKQYKQVIKELLISYYDKLYTHSIHTNKHVIKTIKSDDDANIIKQLINDFKHL